MPGEMSRGRTSGSRTKTLPLIKWCTAMEALIDFFREWSFKKKKAILELEILISSISTDVLLH